MQWREQHSLSGEISCPETALCRRRGRRPHAPQGCSTPCSTEGKFNAYAQTVLVETSTVRVTFFCRKSYQFCSALDRLTSKCRHHHHESVGCACIDLHTYNCARTRMPQIVKVTEEGRTRNRLQEALRKRGFFEVSPEDKDDLKMISEARADIENAWLHQRRVFPRSDARGNPLLCRFSAAQGNLKLR